MPASKQTVHDFILSHIAERTGVGAGEIAGDTVLVDIGLQSIDAVLICGDIEDHFDVEIDPALMFEFQTFGEVVNEVAKLVEG